MARDRSFLAVAWDLYKAEKRGETLVAVPQFGLPVVRNLVWRLKVDFASRRWESYVQNASPEEWANATRRMMRDYG